MYALKKKILNTRYRLTPASTKIMEHVFKSTVVNKLLINLDPSSLSHHF